MLPKVSKKNLSSRSITFVRSIVRTCIAALHLLCLISIINATICKGSQEVRENVTVDVTFPIEDICFSQRMDGELVPCMSVTSIVLSPREFLTLIVDQRVTNYLDILPTQTKEIEEAIADLGAEINKFEKVIRRPHDDTTYMNARNQLAATIDKYQGIERTILLEHQVERLQQIIRQYEISRVGLLNYLHDSEFGSFLEIRPEQLKQFLESENEFKKKMEPRLNKLKEKSKTEILACLTSEQRKRLEIATWPENDFPTGDLWLFIAQNSDSFMADIEFESDVLNARWPSYFPVVLPSILTADLDGTLRASAGASLLDCEEFLIHVRLVIELGRNKPMVQFLGLSAEQIERLMDIRSAWLEFGERRNSEWSSMREFMREREIEKHWENLEERTINSQIREMESVLSNEQRSQLVVLCNRLLVHRIGLAKALTNRRDGWKIRIDEGQKNEISERVEALRTEFLDELKKIEREYKTHMLKKLTPDQREKYDAAVGEDMKLENGNLELYWRMTGVKIGDEFVALRMLMAMRAKLFGRIPTVTR